AESGDDPGDRVDVPALQDRLLPPEQQILAGALHNDSIQELTSSQTIGYIQELARKPLEARVEELRGLIRQAEQSGEVRRAMELVGEKRDLEEKLSSDYLCGKPA